MDLPILYEDANIVAVNKPAGLLTHASQVGRLDLPKQVTAESWFKAKYPEVTLERSYVHRLDRETSGVLVFAKNEGAWDFLRKAFTDREVKKTYLAVVYGVPKEKKGIIDFDIGRSRKDFRLRSAQPKARGTLRGAVTRYEVLGEIETAAQKYALLELHPETGRTHQLRVHLKAIHHPIVGDKLYAGKRSSVSPGLRSFSEVGLALHAYALDLPLPPGGHTVIIAPTPPDLASILTRFPDVAGQFASE
ncbi:MAG: RluA family pseudouridine synthase [bacterium]|nr:RluA family pseudouridine synthase [bacterium]